MPRRDSCPCLRGFNSRPCNQSQSTMRQLLLDIDCGRRESPGSQIEQWRDVPEFPGYEVSSFGRFRNTMRGLLNGTRAHNGYIHIGLTVDGVQRWRLAHRLVAIAFIDNPHSHPVVNHIDGDRSNNRVSNLEWASRSHNAKDMWARKKGLA